MASTTRAMIYGAMILFTIVSIATTYISLNDSILPAPKISIPFSSTFVWQCSILALIFSIALDVFLFALKCAIIEGEKRLNFFGIIGMGILAFVSIAFNMDVLYRTADKEFFLRYSIAEMKSSYTDYLAEVQTALLKKEQELRIDVAKQEGELEAEEKGLREKPAGYGPEARKEDYALTLLRKTSEVGLESLAEAKAAKEKADALLAGTTPKDLDEIQQLQDQIRVACKDVGAFVGVPLPEPVRQRYPLFAVFSKLFDFKQVGIMEIFIMFVAIILDLGDIMGYCLVPNKPKKPKPLSVTAIPAALGPEVIPQVAVGHTPLVGFDNGEAESEEESHAGAAAAVPGMRFSRRRTKRPFRFGRH